MEKPNIIIKDFWASSILYYGKVDLPKVVAEAGIQSIAKLLFAMEIVIDREKDIIATNPDLYFYVYI